MGRNFIWQLDEYLADSSLVVVKADTQLLQATRIHMQENHVNLSSRAS